MDNNQKANNKSIFILILSLALVVITGTFAWLSWRSQNTAMVLTIGDIKGLTVSLKPYQINASLSPKSTYTDGIVIDVAAANAKNEADNFKLFYKITTIDDALKDQGFKYTITKCTSNCTNASNYTLLNDAGGNFASASSGGNLQIYKETVPANTTYKYKVYLWIDSSAGNQSSMQNKQFVGELRASISASAYSIMRDNAVMDNVKSTYVSATTGINWNNTSSEWNGKGIYLRAGTENDPYPIYYYRGAVTDNNVLFAGYCWKIVRTTSTGGTKLIYNGVYKNNTCNNTGTDAQLPTTSKFNNSYKSLADVGYMVGTRYEGTPKTMTSITETYMYATGYDETNHKLVTTNAISFAGTDWKTNDNYKSLNNNHYTCFNSTGECDQVYYIYYTTNSAAYYVTIPSGKTTTMMLDEMLTSSTNTTDSTIKTAIDTWYAANMTSYTNKLEDTPYCNDRTIYQYNGWDPNGGDTTKSLYLGAYGRTQSPYTPSLTCSINDAFTLPGNALGNGKLTYPVGLLTADEIRLGGGKSGSSNSSYYLYTGVEWWSGSPYVFNTYNAYVFHAIKSGNLYNTVVNYANGVRPAVSLKPGTKFASGDGSYTDPYVVE